MTASYAFPAKPPHLCTAVSDGVLYRGGVRELTPTRKRRAA